MPLNENDQFWVARNGQTFGPYSAGEVRDYLRAGNIVPSDHVRGEKDTDWRTVADALGLAAAPPMPGVPAAGANDASASDDPNGFAIAVWGLGLGVAGLFCCGFFTAAPGLFLSRKAMRSNVDRTYQLGLAGVVTNVVAIIVSILSLCLFWAFLQQLAPALENATRGIQ